MNYESYHTRLRPTGVFFGFGNGPVAEAEPTRPASECARVADGPKEWTISLKESTYSPR